MADQVADFFTKIFNTASWPPRWHCGSWTDFHGWLYILSDLGIWAAYFAIPVLLIRVLTKRKDIPFHNIFILFVAFILLCGLTHLMDAIIFWWPAYRLSALLRFVTSMVSIFTVFGLYKVLPLALTLRSVNELEEEIEKRKTAEVALINSLEESRKSNEQLKSFTHILSHNIRNHASNLALLSMVVDPKTLSSENTEVFAKIKKVSLGLNTTLADLSHAIRIKSAVIEPELLDFKLLTNKVLTIFEPQLSVIPHTINLNYDVPEVSFSKVYLESILTNLISNAIKYREPNRHLLIELATGKDANGKTQLVCKDNGLGINLNLHGKKIFGLYKTFHEHAEANGVGLFLVKTQIESQGGYIAVESTPGIGSTFIITFNE